jgi:hypothetical protein
LPRGQWPQVLFWPFSIGYFSNWCVDGALLFKHTALYIIFDTLDLAMCIQTGTMGNPKSPYSTLNPKCHIKPKKY